jgi:hypothetical protein
MPREILSLKRLEDDSFGIFIDGELDEIYHLDNEHQEISAVALPIKMWRAFNRVLEKRIKSLKSSSDIDETYELGKADLQPEFK